MTINLVIDDIAAVTLNALLAFFTLGIVVSTFVQIWITIKMQRRMNWLTGSLESHSQLRLIMAAREQELEPIWWDPKHRGDGTKHWPNLTGAHHGERIRMQRVYVGIPVKDRTKISWLSRWFQKFRRAAK